MPAEDVTDLPAVVVTASRPGSATAPSVAEQRRALENTAAAVRLVPAEAFENRFAFTLRDVFADTPGVFVGSRYGQELRLSIRGSGVARGFHLRGIEVLQDGIPVNLADGSGDFYQIDPLAARTVQVYPGGDALTFGSSTLGGAVNFVTPTARTAEAPNTLRVEGGSYGTVRVNAGMGRVSGDWDAYATGTVVHSDGFRQHSTSQYEQVNGNVGYRVSPEVETRFYVGSYSVRQQLPGSLTLDDALRRRTIASAAALAGNQARDVQAERIANRTMVTLAPGWFDTARLELETWLTHKNLYHPIFQVIAQDGLTWGVAPRFTGTYTAGGLRNELVVGARYFAGTNDARQYVNVHGGRGALTLNARQDASNYEAYAENRTFVLPTLAVVAGAKGLVDERTYRDFGGGLPASLGDRRFTRTYEGFNPRVGLLWLPRPEIQVFTNLTRSQDVPDFSDLLQTGITRTSFVPLQAQRAYTVEAGTRGRYDGYGWDITAFRSNIQGQLLQFTTNPTLGTSGTINAGNTVNQGVELGGRVDVGRGVLAAGDRVTLRQTWTFNDFRFRDDRTYRNNTVAGLPPHVLRTSVTYARPSGEPGTGFTVTPLVDWVPVGAYADYANTLHAPGNARVGLEATWTPRAGVTAFVDARNLANRRFISDVTTVTDARRVGTAVFYPGEGASAYAGVRVSF